MDKDGIPESAMVIVAHPDDAEFTMAGTVAAWAQAGCHITYVLCTDGNAGSHEPGMTREMLAEIRRREQRAACATLGVGDVVFLGYDDGQLQPTLELRPIKLSAEPFQWLLQSGRSLPDSQIGVVLSKRPVLRNHECLSSYSPFHYDGNQLVLPVLSFDLDCGFGTSVKPNADVT